MVNKFKIFYGGSKKDMTINFIKSGGTENVQNQKNYNLQIEIKLKAKEEKNKPNLSSKEMGKKSTSIVDAPPLGLPPPPVTTTTTGGPVTTRERPRTPTVAASIPINLSDVDIEVLVAFNDLKYNKITTTLINFLISQNIITQPSLNVGGTIFFGSRNNKNEFIELLFNSADYKNISLDSNSFYFVKSF